MKTERAIEAGQTVKAYGHEWEVLDADYNGGILCLMKEQLKQMAFSEDNNNYYPDSDVCKYLADETETLRNRGAKFEGVSLSMRADDGTGWDKENFEVYGLFLLTADLYREYRQHISNKEDWWWLATAYSYSSGDSSSARYVSTDGTLSNSSACYGHIGVSPACVFSFLPDEEGETDTAKADLEELIESMKQIVRDNKVIRERLKSIEDRLDDLED